MVDARNGGRHRAPGLLAALCLVGAIAGSLGETASAHDDAPPTPAPGRPVDIRPSSTGGWQRPIEAFGPTIGEHVDIVNARAWHDAGLDGDGVRIGVIDFFDVTRYWNAAEHGPVPVAGVTAACFSDGADCTGEFFDGTDLGGEDHGVAVVETILDVAPGVEILIGQALTIGDYERLIDWFAARDVDIISRSLGSRYDGPGDGRGELNEVVDRAVAAGMMWVNSAGNNARNKYYRHPVRLAGDRVVFGATGTSTFLRFQGCISLGGVRWANDWDIPADQRTDYDLALWNSPTGNPAAGTIVDRAQDRQQLGAPPIEHLVVSRCPTPGASLYLEVIWNGGDPSGDVLEILDYGSGIATSTVAAGSATVSVVDSRNPGAIAVGAIDPAAGGTIAGYSSQGPANDGRVIPDLAAPANFVNTIDGRFAGTSAAAAVVSGAAALLLDAELAASPTNLADLVRHHVIDRGAPGPDTAYGFGEFRLPAPPTAGVDSTPSRFVGLDAPARALDTRPESPAGPAELVGAVRRGELIDLPMAGTFGVPTEGLTAVVVNVVSVASDRASFVQALPTDVGTVGGFSTLNVDAPGQVRANFAVVPIGSDGRISLYSFADGHLVVDLLGWFERTDGPVRGGRFVELPAADRVLDTRDDPPAVPLATGAVRNVPMPEGVDDTLVDALVVTVTATESTAPGWVQAYPAARADVIGTTSTVNVDIGGAVANTAIVPVSDEGIAVAGSFGAGGSAHVVVDVIGYITSDSAASSSAGRFVALRPGRAFDSRSSGGPVADEVPVVVDAAKGAEVPDDASGVVWNAVIVDALRPGFARTWAADSARPQTSSLNWSTFGEIRASAVISAVDGGRARFELSDGEGRRPVRLGDLVVDVSGYFT